MAKVEYIVETFLGNDRLGYHYSKEWLMWRLRWFHEFTLKSLLNQSFKDFAIFVQVGNRFRLIFETYNWHPACNICFDYGADLYSKIDADYLSITRIDSDDLFHREAMLLVADQLIHFLQQGRLDGQDRFVMAFKNNIYWDILNRMIARHIRNSTPFYTHVFPRKVFKSWPRFKDLHFRAHGSGGAGDRGAYELPAGMVCVTKHGYNTSLIKRDLPPFKLSAAQRRSMGSFDEGMKLNRADMVKILAAYGVDPKYVKGD